MNDLDWMQQAYQQALLAKHAQEVPVGAVLVSADNQLLAVGHNKVSQNVDPSAHAEIIALRQGALAVGNHRLLDATLYVTLEPCIMCAGAIVHARIRRLVFATRDFKAGAAGSVFNVLNGFPLNHKVLIDEGVMQQSCSHLLSEFFKTRRLITPTT